MRELDVAQEFSPSLGARYPADGPFGGELFRDKYLLPQLENAVKQDEKLRVDFGGVSGMPTSFLEEAFGGLLRKKRDWSLQFIREHLEIAAPARPRLWPFVQLAYEYMEKANERR
jgi:hypothetical protein